jgi:hypothetical protein
MTMNSLASLHTEVNSHYGYYAFWEHPTRRETFSAQEGQYTVKVCNFE